MNVYLREMRAYRKSTIVWSLSMAGLIIMYMALYPAFTKDVAAAREMFGQLPPALSDAFNINLDTFFSIYGWYGYLLTFAALAGAILAMNMGTGVISKEVAGKTADFLFSKPMTRTRAVTEKLLAAFTVVLITDAVFAIVAWVCAVAVSSDPVRFGTFSLITLTLLLVQTVFFALGALLSVVIPKIKSVVSVSLPTVFAFYIVGMLGDVLNREEVRYASPFRYYDPTYIIEHTSLEGRYLALEAVVVVVAIAATYLIFMKKNIRAAA